MIIGKERNETRYSCKEKTIWIYIQEKFSDCVPFVILSFEINKEKKRELSLRKVRIFVWNEMKKEEKIKIFQ